MSTEITGSSDGQLATELEVGTDRVIIQYINSGGKHSRGNISKAQLGRICRAAAVNLRICKQVDGGDWPQEDQEAMELAEALGYDLT